MGHLRVGRVRVGLVLVAALLAGACGGGGAGSSDEGAEPGIGPVGADGGAEPGGESQAAPAAVSEVSEDAGVEPQGFGGQPLGDFDLERLLEAARTLDPDADCPVAVGPESLDGVVEVLRIEGGCAIVDYVALGGRSVSEARVEILASDPAAHAVGLPPRDLQPDVWQTPPSPYDGDGYGAGDWWHLDRLGARVLWDPAGWEYTDDSGNQRRVAGWSEDVIVAVLDSGTFAHRDLEGSLVDAVGGSWLDMECHRDDRSGHGTHVAGLIAAQRGNGRDVAGLAPEARILPIHLLSAGTCPVDGSDLTDR